MDTLRRRCMQILAAAPLLPSATVAGAGRERLAISYNDDYAPYSFIDPAATNLGVQGILPEALELLLKDLNASLSVERVGLPWRRAQSVVQLGQADAICTFASAERKQYAHFGQLPVVELRPHLFFAASHPRRAELERVRAREELKAFQLVDQRGNQWAEQNLADFPKVEWTTGHDAIFRMVMAERGDVHVSLSPLVTQWRLKKLAVQRDIVSIPAPYIAATVPFHLGIRRDHPRALETLAHVDRQLAQPAILQQIDAITRRFIG